ncbi:MAG TPA: hypothetical protein VI874_01955 [Candidatus Norongarragalinales archaeon]|nr:hypothetical protein [Candidatus Norongarragalinales archaeon]
MKNKLDVVVMSSKGQVVVPKAVRDAVDADVGSEFLVFGCENTIIFKKIVVTKFSKKDLEALVASSEKKLKKAGFASEDDVQALVTEAIADVRRS